MAIDDKGGHSSSLEYHRMLLEDPHRIDCYERAIRALVKPGDVVLDLGAGTGILGLLAAKAGAARVHLVESMPVAELARELVAHNERSGVLGSGVVTVHETDVVGLDPVEPVDWVISDFMGHFVVDDGMMDAVTAAGAWLKPHGRFCPAEVHMQLAPVVDVKFRAIDFWRERFLGLDLSPGASWGYRSFYLGQLRKHALAAEASSHASFRPPDTGIPTRSAHSFLVQKAGQLRAVAGFFDAHLTPDIVLSSRPGTQTHWGQILFPVDEVDVEPGDTVYFELEQVGGTASWRWAARVTTADGITECQYDDAQWRHDE